MFEGYSDAYNANARLIILKALVGEDDGRLSDHLLMVTLHAFAIRRSREYLLDQLRWLETEVGAVRTMKAGTATIAEITEAGEAHVRRERLLPGIQKPSRPRV